MPLVTLQSNLSWYGSPGFQAAQSVEQTRFNYDNGDLTSTVAPRGFDNAGFQSNAFIPRVSSNSFNIYSQGTATRRSQLGIGTKFPIGPEGQIHQFDIKRTGFHDGNRYETLFNSKSNRGLADTYTAASPIDDMYNKFKVRDEVYDPYGYARTPFILRGIQRDGNSEPQRYGINAPTLNVPNGGIVTANQRGLEDTARIGKFLIRPDGLMFIAKQNILRQTIANIESTFNIGSGVPGGAISKITQQRIYNPVNTLASITSNISGVRFRNFGLLPVDDGISKYEDVVVKNRVLESMKYNRNRLNILNRERTGPILSQSPYWVATSNLFGGPDSVGGVGPSLHTKSSVSKTPGFLEQQLEPQYTWDAPYLKTRDGSVPLMARGDTPQEQIDNGYAVPDLLNRQYNERAYHNTLLPSYGTPYSTDLFKKLISREKNSLYQIGSQINPYLPTQASGKRRIQLPLTGLQAQLIFHKEDIPNYGPEHEIRDTRLRDRYSSPYIGERNDTGITGDEITDEDSELGFRDNTLQTRTPEKSVANNEGGVASTITAYKRLVYADIRRITKDRTIGSTTTIDFRTGNEYDNTTTLEGKYGYVSYGFGERTDKPDPVMADTEGAKDLIDFSFEPSDGGATNDQNVIKFRAYITSLSDNFSPSWDALQDQGRADPKIRYQSFTREINIGFKAVVHSAGERDKVWTKLGQLAQITYPVYGTGFGGKYVRVTVGNLYKSTPMYITSLGYTWDTDTPWEIQEGNQLPLYTDVDISLGYIGEKRPAYGNAVFG